jgi:hypothetical protein
MQMLVPTLLVEKNMFAVFVDHVLPEKAQEAPKPSILWYTLVQFTVQVCARPDRDDTASASKPTDKPVRTFKHIFIWVNFYVTSRQLKFSTAAQSGSGFDKSLPPLSLGWCNLTHFPTGDKFY